MRFLQKYWYKLLIILITVLILAFVFPNITNAKGFIESAGGDLWEPIQEFLVWIGDCVLNLLQNTFLTQQRIVVTANSASEQEGVSAWSIILLLGSVALMIVGGIFAWTGIGAAGFVAGLKGVCIGIACVAGGIIASSIAVNDMSSKLSGDFDIPMIAYTPYAIFSNSVPAFDINFIKPKEDVEDDSLNIEVLGDAKELEELMYYVGNLRDNYGSGEINWDKKKEAANNFVNLLNSITQEEIDNYEDEVNDGLDLQEVMDLYKYMPQAIEQLKENDEEWIEVGGDENDRALSYDVVFSQIVVGNLTYSTEAYSKLERFLCSITRTNKNTVIYESSAKILQPIISSWYYTLRNLSIVGLLSVLVYIGIRIVISSTANEKAKYKSMIMDWVIAICLIFFLHYIMVFIIEINSQLISMFANNVTENIPVDLPKDTQIKDGGNTVNLLESAKEQDGFEVSDTGNPRLVTNFVGYVRLIAGGYHEYDTMTSAVYCIIYLVLVIYTVIFTVTYLKRVIYMAFLTMVAPLVSLTYPIDKLNDGKAQAFNMWLKEYIFNALLQPIHLLLYTITVGSVMDLAVKYPVYALVALGFLVPAEKIIRKMFGFEKAQTPGALGGAAGTALMMTGMQNLLRKPPHKSGNSEGGAKASDSSKGDEKLRFNSDKVNMAEALQGDINKPDQTSVQGMNQLPQGGNNSQEMEGQIPELNYNNASQIGSMLGYQPGDSNGGERTGNINLEQNNTGYNQLSRGINNRRDMKGEIPEFSYNNANQIGSMLENQVKNNDGSGRTNTKNLQQDNQRGETVGRQLGKNNTGYNQSRRTANRYSSPNKVKRIMNGVSSAARFRGREYKRRMNRTIKNFRPLRMLRRGTTAIMGGAAAGAVGIAAGIASGDLSKALQYTTTGAVLGGKFAMGAGDQIADNIRVEGSEEQFKKGYYTPEEYDEKNKQEKIKEKISDENHWRALENQGFSQKQIKEINSNFLPECYNRGITDTEDIGAAFKLKTKLQEEGNNEEEAKVKALGTAQLVNKYGTSFRNSAKQQEDLEKSLSKNDYKEVKDKEDKTRLVKTSMELMDEFLNQKESKEPFHPIRFKQ